jgi:NRAMP (natural resistance-associated macrophage protein)-like metal ion transporter
MPGNLYLHSKLVQILRGTEGNKTAATLGFIYAAVAAFFINCGAAASFSVFSADHTCEVNGKAMKCAQVGLADSIDMLHDKVHPAASILWAVSMLLSGLIASISNTITGQLVMDGFVQIKLPRWKRALITRSVVVIPAAVFALQFRHKMYLVDDIMNFVQVGQLKYAFDVEPRNENEITVLVALLFTGCQSAFHPFAT